MKLQGIAERLREEVNALSFEAPVAYVYNPLDYAWEPHCAYLERAISGPEAVFVGMNPGPWGMAQTGVPFGDVAWVRDFLGIEGRVGKPELVHPKRPIQGFDCPRSEVSGSRLWSWAKEHFGTADAFFSRFFIINHCPLAFLEESGRNRTPDKLPVAERSALEAVCDAALARTVEALKPAWVIGIGAHAQKRARLALPEGVQIGKILHPSPASPVANRGWAPQATAQLRALGIQIP